MKEEFYILVVFFLFKMKLTAPKSNETFAAYSHWTALIFALIGSVYLIVLARANVGLLITIIIYSFCLCFMFGASALYHTLKREDFEVSVWRKIDHIAIYFMIAGSYTGISYLYTDGNVRKLSRTSPVRRPSGGPFSFQSL